MTLISSICSKRLHSVARKWLGTIRANIVLKGLLGRQWQGSKGGYSHILSKRIPPRHYRSVGRRTISRHDHGKNLEGRQSQQPKKTFNRHLESSVSTQGTITHMLLLFHQASPRS